MDLLLQNAMAHHRAGQLPQAEALYQQTLRVSPDHPDALHLLGLIAHQVGKHEIAVELIDKAIEINPRNPDAYSNRGNALHALKRYQAALESCDKAIHLKPDYAEAYSNRGNSLIELKQYQAALESCDKAILLKPVLAEAYINRGNALRELKQYQAALESYDRAVFLKLDYVEAYINRGHALMELKQYRAALESYDKAILLKLDSAEAYINRGNALEELKEYQAALESYDRAILLKPDSAEAYINRGNALMELKQYRAALESYDQVIVLKPDSGEAYNNRGNVLRELKEYQAALESFDQAILLKPDSGEAYNNRGNVLRELKEYQAALESYDKAILLKPDSAEACNNCGNVLRALKEYQAALESCDKAILLKPDYAEAYNDRGIALEGLKQYQAALESYDQAILLKPDCTEAYSNRGNALMGLKEYQAALESYDKAILLKPDYLEAYINRGKALYDLKLYQAALESYDKAILLKPDYEYLQGTRLHMKRYLCDWGDLENQCTRLETRIDHDEKASLPFFALAISSSPSLQRKAAEIYVQDQHPLPPISAAIPKRPGREKIRIGYFSADYHNHATCYLMAELFERHDKNKFELLGFSFGSDTNDEMRKRVAAAMDRFMDVRFLPDQEVAQLCRNLEVDIAVDLKGFTQHNRTGIFAERAAPIQVNYLGYPGTLGAAYMDYLIADHTLIPEDSRRYYSEKIAYLPDSYQVNDSRRSISTKPRARAEEGLPETGFVYCCFNNNYKITPGTFDIWMRILGRVEGSVLWLLEDNPWAGSNLRKEAALRGISPQRLIFAGRRPLPEHLARHRLADLFLDTFPCNAHTTASDALWAGLPVLTWIGETFASRVAASLLRAIHMPELITTTPEAYEALAVEIAVHPERSREIKERLQRNRLTTPLFDIQSFTRHIEAAYTAMYARYQADMPPEHIDIAGFGRV